MSNKMIKVVSLLLALCLMATIFVGCSKTETPADKPADTPASSDTPSSEDKPAEETPAEPGSVTGRTDVIIGYAQECNTMDPNNMGDGSSYAMSASIYEGLVFLNNDLELEPRLAETWDISEDGMTYTFHLREGVTFHNGEPFTAKDVVYSYDRAAAGGFASSAMGVIDSYRAVDDKTFECTLKFPYAPALELFASNWLRVVNQKAVEEAGEQFSYNPVGAGTGPYYFVEWSSGVNLILKAYENYWREPASIKDVEIRFINDTTALTLAIETGDIDYGNIQVADIENFEANENLDWDHTASLIENYIGINCQDEHFSDVRVRQAVSLCVDRMEAMIVGNDSELGGSLTATDTPASGFGAHPDLEIPQMDLEKAKELLTEAGYPDGFSTQIYVANIASRKNMATYLQAQIKKIGIEAELISMEQSAVLEAMRNGEAPIFLMGYSATSGDADFFLYPQFHSGETLNYFNYYNDELDAKLEAARQTTDAAEREALYKEIQEELYENVPNLPMYHIYMRVGFNAALNCEAAPVHRLYIYEWSWD